MVLMVASVIAAGVVFAHSNSDEPYDRNTKNIHRCGAGYADMDAMHDAMTSNLDPESKKQMDEMHEQMEEYFTNNRWQMHGMMW